MRISMAAIFVNDQSRAKAFYTGQLGFQPHTDAEYGPGARWLSVAQMPSWTTPAATICLHQD